MIFLNLEIYFEYGDWGLGIGDWGLGIGGWAQSPIPNPQSPIPNPHFKILILNLILKTFIYISKINTKVELKLKI